MAQTSGQSSSSSNQSSQPEQTDDAGGSRQRATLTKWLASLRLEEWLPHLVTFGVDQLSDLGEIDEEDLEFLVKSVVSGIGDEGSGAAASG